MDTEEDNKLKTAIQNGLPETDEGPYYHGAWWEAYKGGVKGKFGGGVIGAVIGGVLGVVAGGILLATGGISVGIAGAIAVGFATSGMLYGAHEFTDVGKVSGAVAAAHETSEHRMKEFENGKFAEIKRDINDLKRMVGGQGSVSRQEALDEMFPRVDVHSAPHRTEHCSDGHCPPQQSKFVFWKVALIGLVVGIAAGALLAFGGGAEHIIGSLGGEKTVTALAGKDGIGLYAASMAVMGLAGASFGINRDIFRRIFDKTDRLFRGLPAQGKSPEPALSQGQGLGAYRTSHIAPSEPLVNTVVYDNFPDFPQSDTYHRDRVLASAKQALLSMDHTKSIPH